MEEKNKVQSEETETIIERMDRLRGEVDFHLYNIETMITLGKVAAMAEGERKNYKVEWSMVFNILRELYEDTQDSLEKLEMAINDARK